MNLKFSKLKRNDAGYRELRTHRKSHKLVKKYAQEIADAAGPAWEVREAPSKNRARVTVVTEDWDAKFADNRDQILLGAVGKVKR